MQVKKWRKRIIVRGLLIIPPERGEEDSKKSEHELGFGYMSGTPRAFPVHSPQSIPGKEVALPSSFKKKEFGAPGGLRPLSV